MSYYVLLVNRDLKEGIPGHTRDSLSFLSINIIGRIDRRKYQNNNETTEYSLPHEC